MESFREMYYNGGRNARAAEARDDRGVCQKEKNPPKASFQIPHPVEPQRAIRKVLYLNL